MTFSFVRRIERQSKIDNVPNQWAEAYKTSSYGSDKLVIREKLFALPKPLTREAVDGVIGNDSWTALPCDLCEADDHPSIIRIGSIPDYEAQWIDLCEKCIAGLPEMITKAPIAKE